MVQSRRVSLRVGSFGLTYSTERLLWDGAQGAASSFADPTLAYPAADPTRTDPPPVDAAPAVESERPQNQTESSTFPLDLEAERKRALWTAAQEQVAHEQSRANSVNAPAKDSATQSAAAQSGAAQTSQTDQTPRRRSTDRIEPNAKAFNTEAAGAADGVVDGAVELASALTNGSSAQAGQAGLTDKAGRKAALAQAMRQATQAYQTCAASFACPRPMLQAVA